MVATATRARLPTADEVRQGQGRRSGRASHARRQHQGPGHRLAGRRAESPWRRAGQRCRALSPTIAARSLVHGSAGVSVGTGGYRSAYVSAVMPVGDNGMLGIAYSQTDLRQEQPVWATVTAMAVTAAVMEITAACRAAARPGPSACPIPPMTATARPAHPQAAHPAFQDGGPLPGTLVGHPHARRPPVRRLPYSH
ncbi:MAG: hypothetical protein WDN06_18565 [Asticcacaulis sp.]